LYGILLCAPLPAVSFIMMTSLVLKTKSACAVFCQQLIFHNSPSVKQHYKLREK